MMISLSAQVTEQELASYSLSCVALKWPHNSPPHTSASALSQVCGLRMLTALNFQI